MCYVAWSWSVGCSDNTHEHGGDPDILDNDVCRQYGNTLGLVGHTSNTTTSLVTHPMLFYVGLRLWVLHDWTGLNRVRPEPTDHL
ncbi:hypothetical protein GDO78_020632 [Eleutherodactylus coqui]|uniref:Uncharacterized protein n=1 Tax=Eleutherodactylus coqui TaxID=57060 RepID=A0A8J6BBA4_ELECQ|nr:hypothetical protein GDO78_020632 [Eleutherodactylus coqui]